MAPEAICRNVLYSGRVQGVGFRYTTVRVAANHDVAGYVRNLDDGRVELVAQGSPEQVGRFLLDIRRTMGSNVRRAEESEMVPTASFVRFDIRY